MSKFYRNNKGFLRTLTKGSGLYLLLGATGLVTLCVAALLFSPEPEEQVLVPSDNAPSVSLPVTDDLAAPVVGGSITDGETDASSDGSANVPGEDDGPQDDAPQEDVSMIVPVSGSLGTGFSLTVPVFSETMNDWRVHQGIDYKTEGEVQVVAAADGIVENVYTCELMGLTVEIRHADETLSIYQSLGGELQVIEGQEVRQGDLIGMTGTSADSECLEGNHLHFALIRGGVYLDPNDRFAS